MGILHFGKHLGRRHKNGKTRYTAPPPQVRQARRPLRAVPRQSGALQAETPAAPAAREPHSDLRLLALVLVLLLLFALCEARLYLLALDDTAYAAVKKQSIWSQQLTRGRGIIYDHALRPMTDTALQYAAVVRFGTQDYTRLFSAALDEEKAALYEGVGSSNPFVVRLRAAVPEDGETFTFAYPLRYDPVPLAQHVIGYCNGEGRGVSGLERAFDGYLTGGSDLLTVECTTNALAQAAGQTPRLIRTQGTGNGLQLTLDTVLQRTCEDVACQYIPTGAIVLLECRTGRVKGCVSMPQYDPNDIYKSIRAQDTALINRAFSSYNVGSVYKPVLAALALEQGFDAGTLYECAGSIEVDGHTYRCARRSGHGAIDLAGALQYSCNCYFIWLGQQLGGQDIVDFSALCGLGSATQLGGGYRAGSGNLPTAAQLQNSGELAGLSFGQGKLTATPLQMAAAFNVFANDGIYVSPSLVEGEVNCYTMQVTKSLYRPCQLQVMSAENAALMRRMLVDVVEEGLGSGAAIPEAAVGGKTGTAQTGRTHTGADGEPAELLESWFVGFYPADDPRYTIAVMMDDTDVMGEAVAPVFAALCRQLYYLGC